MAADQNFQPRPARMACVLKSSNLTRVIVVVEVGEVGKPVFQPAEQPGGEGIINARARRPAPFRCCRPMDLG